MRANNFTKKSANLVRSISLDLFAILKVLLRSDFFYNDIKQLKSAQFNECVVIGNGPSFKETLGNISFFSGKKTVCVSEFAMSEYFPVIKPDFYVFFDTSYWDKNTSSEFCSLIEKDFKVIKEKVSWPMTIIMPLCARQWNRFIDLPKWNRNIKLCYINPTTVNCSKSLRNFLYSKNLAMPRAQTVLIGALFLALNLGFKKVFLVGADHSWHENIHLGEDNTLYMKNEHFYFEKNLSLTPLFLDPQCTEKTKVHVFFNALSRAFEAHQQLAEYAKFIGAEIWNASKKTYIDAYERYRIQG